MKCSRARCSFQADLKGLCPTHWLSAFNAREEARQYQTPEERRQADIEHGWIKEDEL